MVAKSMLIVALVSCSALVGPAPTFAEEPFSSTAVLRLVNEADAAARSTGLVINLLVSEGDVVTEGELLARLDETKAKLAVEASELELAVAMHKASNDVAIRYSEKAIEVAEAELARSEESIKKFAGSVSQSQIDVERLTAEKAKLDLELAEKEQETANLEVEQRRKEFQAAQVELERCQIRSPMVGQVVEVAVHQGAWLELGQKAFRIVNIDLLKAETYLDSSQAKFLKIGDEVKVTGLLGKISFISPEVDPVNQQVRVLIEVSNKDLKLRPGDRATIEFYSVSEHQ